MKAGITRLRPNWKPSTSRVSRIPTLTPSIPHYQRREPASPHGLIALLYLGLGAQLRQARGHCHPPSPARPTCTPCACRSKQRPCSMHISSGALSLAAPASAAPSPPRHRSSWMSLDASACYSARWDTPTSQDVQAAIPDDVAVDAVLNAVHATGTSPPVATDLAEGCQRR